ncbi:uncharacterized protein K444DRAFT_614272, partial [Hyaloscypha bicolor E]
LVRAQTYRVTEVEGFLVIKDFLQVIVAKFIPIWGETRAEKHPWKPVNCSILELAVRERLAKGYEKLYGQLEKKG